MSPLCLHSLAGDLPATILPPADSPVRQTIGRSHRATYRSALPDVSGLHLYLDALSGGEELAIEVISQTSLTSLNDERLRQGDKRPLKPGDILQLGSKLRLQCAQLEPATPAEPIAGADPNATVPPGARPAVAPAAPADPNATAPVVRAVPDPPTQPVQTKPVAKPVEESPAAADATQCFEGGKTQRISPEELEKLQARERAEELRHLRKQGILMAALLLIIGAIAFKACSRDTSPLPSIAGIVYPMRTLALGTYTKQVTVAKGVPVRLTLEVSEDPVELRRSRTASLQAWLDAQRQQPGHRYELDDAWRRTARADTQRYLMPAPGECFATEAYLFSAYGHGLQGVQMQYRHTTPEGKAFVGRVVLLRHAERRWVFTREVPWSERDRCQQLFYATRDFFNPAAEGEELVNAVDRTWDYVPNLPEAKNALPKEEVEARLRLGPKPAEWPKLESALLAQLCATAPGSEQRQAWETLLVKFRDHQRAWLATWPMTNEEKGNAFPWPERDNRATGKSVD